MSVSLDEVVALNEEIAALVRAGVPLGDGLKSAGHDLPGRLGRVATELGERIQSGQSLDQAFAALSPSLPPIYRSVVAAGIKSGRLPAALESLAESARRLSEMRRVVTLASVYPIMVLIIACDLFGFLAIKIIPSFQRLVDFSNSSVYQFLLSLKDEWLRWILIAPLPIVMGGIILWYRAGKANRLALGSSDSRRRWFPSLNRIISTASAASLSETLGLLIEHGVPLHEAVQLACETTGDSRVAEAGRELAAHLERGGEANFDPHLASRALPPRVVGHLLGKRNSQSLSRVLQSLATMYHRRALRESDWLGFLLPTLLTVAIGGTVTLLYTLTVFWPFTEMLKKIADYHFMSS